VLQARRGLRPGHAIGEHEAAARAHDREVELEQAHDALVLAPGVEETAPEESLEPESDEDDEPSPSSLDAEPADDGSYGSLEVDVVVLVVDDVVAFFFATLASAGSSPSWTRSASTPKTATKLAVAPAAKRRALGTRRRGRDGRCGAAGAVGSSGMTSGSTPDLKSS
jgi:hypothetical protein